MLVVPVKVRHEKLGYHRENTVGQSGLDFRSFNNGPAIHSKLGKRYKLHGSNACPDENGDANT